MDVFISEFIQDLEAKKYNDNHDYDNWFWSYKFADIFVTITHYKSNSHGSRNKCAYYKYRFEEKIDVSNFSNT